MQINIGILNRNNNNNKRMSISFISLVYLLFNNILCLCRANMMKLKKKTAHTSQIIE